MGRGKRRAGTRLSALAQAEAMPASKAERHAEPVRPGPALEAVSLSDSRAVRRLPDSMRPRYAEAEPSPEVKAYARTHAEQVRHGNLKGAVRLLREYPAALKRGYPALDAVVKAIADLAIKESRDDAGLLEDLRLLEGLGGRLQSQPEREPDADEEARRAVVLALRTPAADEEILAAARQAAVAVRTRKAASTAAWRTLNRERPRLVEDWLSPLYLDRFLWRAYGRDYEAMPWPFREELAPVYEEALTRKEPGEEPRELLERCVLPQLLERFWPEVKELIREELAERTFSAKWPFDPERLRAAGGL